MGEERVAAIRVGTCIIIIAAALTVILNCIVIGQGILQDGATTLQKLAAEFNSQAGTMNMHTHLQDTIVKEHRVEEPERIETKKLLELDSKEEILTYIDSISTVKWIVWSVVYIIVVLVIGGVIAITVAVYMAKKEREESIPGNTITFSIRVE